jgi:quinol monooxygenase YgiN
LLIIHVWMRIAADRQDDFARAAAAVEAASQSDEGCLFYRYHRSLTDPDRFMLVERWTDDEALQKHLATPHVQAYFAASEGAIVEREATAFDVSGSRPL